MAEPKFDFYVPEVDDSKTGMHVSKNNGDREDVKLSSLNGSKDDSDEDVGSKEFPVFH